MRINPFFSNVCGNRIGMYRKDQCIANGCCKFLPHCDQHYNEETGDWDYPNRYLITICIGHKLVPTKGGNYDKEIGGMFNDTANVPIL